VLVQRKQGPRDAAGREQRSGTARVLGKHEIGRGEALAGARAEVANIAYWRRDDIEPALAPCHYNRPLQSVRS